MKLRRAVLLVGCAACLSKPEPPAASGNIAFVTSQSFPATMLGTADPDQLCADAATGAMLPGHYIAWLGTSTQAAINRLGTARGWVRRDNLPVADRVNDLTGGKMYHPIRITEIGTDLIAADDFVATGTTPEGMVFNCDDFHDATGRLYVGRASATKDSWTDDTDRPCSDSFRLYCFGTDLDVEVAAPSADGPLAFVTSGTYRLGGGIAQADAICNMEANATDKFVALLATTKANAMSRIATSPPTWVRRDHVRVFDDQLKPIAPINVTFTGEYVTGRVWTGANGIDAVPGATATCNDWLDNTVSAIGDVGASEQTSGKWFFESTDAECDGAYRIYCLER